jgi:hypothetical protein
MSTLKHSWSLCGALTWAACAAQEPTLVASNCSQPEGCTKQALHLDSVDVLLVIDDSASIIGRAAQLKQQLPRMMEALTTGSDGDTRFPPAKSVHVAVTTTDMGVGDMPNPGCTSLGQDGLFVRPAEVGVTCDVAYPGYLSYEGGAAPLSVAESAACVPLAFSTGGPGTQIGCGFEQPLEAALKSVWPSDDPTVTFISGQGHGSDNNQGFLREDSVLVVVVVTDEDDCSAADESIFATHSVDPSASNLRCYHNPDKLYPVQRYVDHLKQVRPGNDNVVFAVVAGIPPELVSDELRAQYDLTKPAEAQRYFDAVLAHPQMQETPVDEDQPIGRLQPSCMTPTGGEGNAIALPPRRLVQVARGFGVNGVLGSLCSSEFGATMGRLIRAVGDKLSPQAGR